MLHEIQIGVYCKKFRQVRIAHEQRMMRIAHDKGRVRIAWNLDWSVFPQTLALIRKNASRMR